MTFNEPQIQQLVASFGEMDQMLSAALRGSGVAAGKSSFSKSRGTITANQKKALRDQVLGFRSVLREFLNRHNVVVSAPLDKDMFAFEMALHFVDVSLEEISPRSLANLGEIDAEGIAEINRLIDDLRDIVTRMFMICCAPEERPGAV